MKKLYSVLFLLLLLAPVALAQRVPQGMKYQAVARDLKGQVLADQSIALRINLISGGNKAALVHYSETHEVTTNQFGLFTLVVGEGKTQGGTFERVPWSSEDIWMEVGIREAGRSQFATVSSSKLLAVPYAFHAATAAELVGKSERVSGQKGDVSRDQPGVVSQNWSLYGNMRTLATRDFIGTTDYVDWVFITNNIERMRITRDGDIDMKNSLTVGNDLTVKQDVFLNTVGGATINNGPLTVANAKPTILTGTLNVNGATDLDNTLNVDGIATISNPTQSSSKTNGALVVVGGVGIGKNLNVGGNTDLDGTLNIDGVTTISNATESSSKTNGALVVVGGVGIGKNINVGGNGDVDGTLNVDGITTVSNATESTSKTNGALVVVGGVGIGKNINVGGNGDVDGTLNVDGATTLNNTLDVDLATTLNNTLDVDGATTLNSTLDVDFATTLNSTLDVDGATTLNSTLNVIGITNITNTTQSTATTNGAFIVAGGVGIGKNINVGGTSNLNGQVTIDASVNGTNQDANAYPLRVQGSNQGIFITVDGSRGNGNDFVTFKDADGIQGRIEGQTLAELESNEEFITANAILAADLATITAEGIACGLQLDLGEVIVMTAQAIVVGANIATYNLQIKAKVGVAFESGNGDYAEWLEKSVLEETFSFGDVVGVRGGKITKNTEMADHFMVISLSPIVLGNMPKQGEEKNYRKVAFMGQVPVKVTGKVAIGDYILPRGDNQGFGMAVNPDKMTLEQYRQIVGVAWTASKANATFSMINVAVGINSNDLVSKLLEQRAELDEVKAELDGVKGKMNGIVGYLKSKDANFKEELFAVPTSAPVAPASAVAVNSSPTPVSVPGSRPILAGLKENFVYSDFSNLFEQKPELFDQSMALVRKSFVQQGADLSKSPELNRLLNDKEYLMSTVKKIYGTKK